jgi:hypothetical protein
MREHKKDIDETRVISHMSEVGQLNAGNRKPHH